VIKVNKLQMLDLNLTLFIFRTYTLFQLQSFFFSRRTCPILY